MKNKLLLFIFIFFLSAFKTSVTAQVNNVIVEKYYISDTLDATDSTNYFDDPTYLSPILPAGSKTYRIYVQLDSGYKIKKIYGTSKYPLKIKSTANFFNNIDRPATAYFGYNFLKSWFGGNPTLALDSWLTLGLYGKSGSVQNQGVLKPEDTDGSLIGGTHNGGGTAAIPGGLMVNRDTAAGIPVDSLDGMVPDTVTYSGWFDNGFKNGGVDTTVFGTVNVGSQFVSTTALLQQSAGVMGATPGSNKVLVAQLTTLGDIAFELNFELINPSGASVNVVADSHGAPVTGDTVVSALLKYPSVFGCKDPHFLEYSANYGCSAPDSCHTRIVFGCMDTSACNYDPHANFHIQYLCCYPGNCNDRDIALVCPEIAGGGELHVFPNPAQDLINLQFSAGTNNAVSYAIYNVYGLALIHKDLGTRSGSITEQVDVSGLQPGSYLVRVTAGNNVQNSTFMKQ